MSNFELQSYLDRRRAEIDAALDAALPAEEAVPPRIHQAMRYAVFAGGKRLRPILVLAGTEACGGDAAACLPFACAVECIHTYSLVHDDLPSLDNDDLRRGRPTVHRAFDEATAILAGDALLTFAIDLMLGPGAGPVPPRVEPGPAREHGHDAADGPLPGRLSGDVAGPTARHIECGARLRALRVLVSAIGTQGMIGGQVLDLLATGDSMDEAAVRAIHERKTGALLRACPVLGGIVAGAPSDLLALLDSYGADLGLAFQIIDDILDIESSSAVLGKSVGKDVAAGKATFPAAIGLEPSRRLAEELARRASRTADAIGPAARPLATLADYTVRRKR